MDFNINSICQHMEMKDLKIDNEGLQRSLSKNNFTYTQGFGEWFGNMKKKITFVDVFFIKQCIYFFWDDGGFDDIDKSASQHLYKSGVGAANANGLGGRNHLMVITDDPMVFMSSYNDEIECMAQEGTKSSSIWGKAKVENLNQLPNDLYNKLKSHKGTLRICKLKQELYEILTNNNNEVFKQITRTFCCEKMKEGVEFKVNGEHIKMTYNLIPRKLIDTRNALRLECVIGWFQKNDEIKRGPRDTRILKIKNNEEIKVHFPELLEYISLANIQSHKRLKVILDNSKDITEEEKVKFIEASGSECILEIANLYNNGEIYNADGVCVNINSSDIKNNVYSELKNQLGEGKIIGTHFIVNGIKINESPCRKGGFKRAKSDSHGGGKEGYGSFGTFSNPVIKFIINNEHKKDFYWSTPYNKSESELTCVGKYIIHFASLSYKYYHCPYTINERTLPQNPHPPPLPTPPSPPNILSCLYNTNPPPQPSSVQPSSVQPSSVQPSLVPPSPPQPSPPQPSPPQPSPPQPSSVQPSSVQPSPVQPSLVPPSSPGYIKESIDVKIKHSVLYRDIIVSGDGLHSSKCDACKSLLSPFSGRFTSEKQRMTFGHIVAESHGGPMEICNFVILCKSCNSSNSTKDYRFWLKETYGVDRLEEFERVRARQLEQLKLWEDENNYKWEIIKI